MKQWIVICSIFVLAGNLWANDEDEALAEEPPPPTINESASPKEKSDKEQPTEKPAAPKEEAKTVAPGAKKDPSDIKITVVPGVSDQTLEQRKAEFIDQMKDRSQEMKARIDGLGESTSQSSPRVRGIMSQDLRDLRGLQSKIERNIQRAKSQSFKTWEPTRQMLIDDMLLLNQNLKNAQRKFNKNR